MMDIKSCNLCCNQGFTFTALHNGLSGPLGLLDSHSGTPLPHATCPHQLSETTEEEPTTLSFLHPSFP